MRGTGPVSDHRRTSCWHPACTSANSAGLPIIAGLLRLDEVRAGDVDHVVRVTAARTDRSYLWPARHQAGSADDPGLPPMGAWFRMKADVPIGAYLPQTQVILRAFKTHGLIVADNGSNWYFTGSADDGWDTRVLDELKSIPAGDFDAVDASSLTASANSAQVRGRAPAPSPTTRASRSISPSTPTRAPAPTSAT